MSLDANDPYALRREGGPYRWSTLIAILSDKGFIQLAEAIELGDARGLHAWATRSQPELERAVASWAAARAELRTIEDCLEQLLTRLQLENDRAASQVLIWATVPERVSTLAWLFLMTTRDAVNQAPDVPGAGLIKQFHDKFDGVRPILNTAFTVELRQDTAFGLATLILTSQLAVHLHTELTEAEIDELRIALDRSTSDQPADMKASDFMLLDVKANCMLIDQAP